MEQFDKSLFIRTLIKKKRLTQREVAEKLGIAPQQLSNKLTGVRPLDADFILKLKPILGDEVLQVVDMGEQEEVATPISDVGIPYYDEDLFECGPGAGFGEVMLSGKEVGKLLVPGVPSRDVFAVRAHGDSMVNHDKPERSIPNGALVVLRRSSLNAVQWGEVYALATADGYIVKRLMPSEREGCVKCVSFNSDEYPAFDLAVADIYDYAMVVAVVCSSLW